MQSVAFSGGVFADIYLLNALRGRFGQGEDDLALTFPRLLLGWMWNINAAALSKAQEKQKQKNER